MQQLLEAVSTECECRSLLEFLHRLFASGVVDTSDDGVSLSYQSIIVEPGVSIVRCVVTQRVLQVHDRSPTLCVVVVEVVLTGVVLVQGDDAVLAGTTLIPGGLLSAHGFGNTIQGLVGVLGCGYSVISRNRLGRSGVQIVLAT